MKSLIRMWQNLIYLGLKSNLRPEQIKKRIISNKINLLVFILFLVIALFDVLDVTANKKPFDNGMFGIYLILLLCIVHLVLNRFYLFHVSRFLLFIDIPLVLLFFAPLVGHSWNSYYFWGPYAPILFSVVPYFLFTEKEEIKWLYVVLVVYFSLSLSYDVILVIISSEGENLVEIIKENYLFYKLIPVIGFIFVNISMYHAFSLNRKYLRDLSKSNDKLEEKNAELEKLNDSKNEFLRIIGHDLRGPTSSIVQFCDLIDARKNNIEREELFELIDIVKLSGEKSYNLLNELLTWAQSQSGIIAFSPKLLILQGIVQESEELMLGNARSKDITLINKFSHNFEVFADVKMLFTILRNLISNAIKFTDKGGEVIVSAENLKEYAKVCISDTGIGIEPKKLKKLFSIGGNYKSKGTNKEEGNGLGLLICKEFVTSHGGEIWAESEVRKGSKFFFTLPHDKTGNHK